MEELPGILGTMKSLEGIAFHLLMIGMGWGFLLVGTSRKLTVPVKLRKILNPIGIVLVLLGLVLAAVVFFYRGFR